MPATGRHVHVGPVTFTPTAGTLIPVTGLKTVSYDEGIEIGEEGADFDIINTVASLMRLAPTFTVETINAFLLLSVPANTRGVLVITARDAYNGVAVAGGGYLFTVTNAFINKRSQQHGHRRYSNSNVSFGAISTDGVTHPVSVTAL